MNKVEHGHDHNTASMKILKRYTGLELDADLDSRLREINRDSELLGERTPSGRLHKSRRRRLIVRIDRCGRFAPTVERSGSTPVEMLLLSRAIAP